MSIRVVVRTRDASAAPDMPGATWTYMQYVLGLERLGFETYWVDVLSGSIDPYKGPHSLDYLVAAFERTAERFGFAGRWCVMDGERSFGMDCDRVDDLADEAGLLVTISGQLDPHSPLMRIPLRAYVDVDPGFTQIWSDQGALSLEGHTHYFTVGLNVGAPEFRAPDAGLEWHPIVPPVVLAEWPALIDERCRRWTTIADWTGSQTAALAREVYGGKRDEFMRVLTLPGETGVRLEPAILFGPGDHTDLGALHEHGWRVRDPVWYAGDPEAYREFIRYSRAELSVAKTGYVKTNSGWISDRTACYLASGKPALVQSTGFEEHLPAGEGLLAFRTLEEAVDGVRRIESDYLAHCRAGRALAEEHCDSAKVLAGLLEKCGLGVAEPTA
jgi:hypothetical protein